MRRSCVSSRLLPPLPRRSIASWNSHARRDATPTPKLRPIPGYGCGEAEHIALPDRGSNAGNMIGGRVVKHRVLLCAGIAALALLASAPRPAQPVPPAYRGAVFPGEALPPHEAVTIVSSTGLEPVGRPVRQGPVYALRAVDPAGEEVRVIVDAYLGRIVKVIPLSGPRYAMPLLRAPYGRPPRPTAMVPGDEFDDFTSIGPGPSGSPSGVARAPRDPAAQAGQAGPPLPRPRPKVASAETAAPQRGGAKDERPTGTVTAPADAAAPPPAGPYDYE